MKFILSEQYDSALFGGAAYLLEKYGGTGDGEKECPVSFIEKEHPGDDYTVTCDGGHIKIYGSTAVAFNAAVGKLLRTEGHLPARYVVHFGQNLRGVYFANHFNNFYHSAPVEAVCNYLEELALWGVSVVQLWFDMHHFTEIGDAEATEMISRMRAVFSKAKQLGMKTSLLRVVNESYESSPKTLRAENSTESGRYAKKLCGYYGTELCPSDDRGKALILRNAEELFENFCDVGLDYLCLWPYDQGGCTCENCYPWGANGYYRLSESISEIALRIFPGIKIICSCWYFDRFTTGEWNAFLQRAKEKKPWFDLLMVNIDDRIPEEIKSLGCPVISFPEISMRGCVPWGGFGANPFPGALKKQFSATSELCAGGILYSEGIFDDINKILSMELFRDTDADPDAILSEYCKYYFGQTCTKELVEIIGKLEKTLYRARYSNDGIRCDYPTGKQTELPVFVFEDDSEVEEIKNRIEAIDRRMPEKVRENFRYRILYLRATGDYELYKNGGCPNEKTDSIFSALNGIYYSENAHYFLAPLTRKSCLENKGHI